MKLKKGFTLAEVIIAVGIIGVIAALMAASFNQMKPDKTKMLYLKAYDALTEAVIAMEDDKTLFAYTYTITDDDDETEDIIVDIEKYPFLDTQEPNGNNYFSGSEYEGKLKFAKILMVALKGEELSKTDDDLSFASGPGNYTWKITPIDEPVFEKDMESILFANKIDLNIGDDENTFSFCVQADGNIQILDNKGQTYINNRKSPRSINDEPAMASVTSCTPDPLTVKQSDDTHYVVNEPSS